MAYEAVLDNDESIHYATNRGVADVREWVKSLPAKPFAALRTLVTEGVSRDVDELPELFEEALEEMPPDPSIETTVRGLVKFLKSNPDANELIISNGV